MTPSYEVEYLVAPSTILIIFNPGYQVSRHQHELTDQIVCWLDRAEGSIYLVLDIADLQIDWPALVTELVDLRAKVLPQVDFRALVIVASNDMLPLCTESFSHLQYEGFQVAILPTLREAMGYIGDTYYHD